MKAAWGLVPVVLVLLAVHSLPHLPGPAADSPAQAIPLLAQRVQAGLAGHDDPYPVHVDEHNHMAKAAQIDREGTVQYSEPYTGEPLRESLFSVQGLRSERGFDVLVAQLHQLTGVSFPALDRFLPALWTGALAVTLWAALRPAPGALASAAFLAILPTGVHFLGVGFLVPSAFALAWIPAVILVACRGRGPARLAGLALLLTGAYSLHIILGTVVLLAALLTALLHGGTRGDRVSLTAAVLLPLVWIVPALYTDAKDAILAQIDLPFEPSIFRTPGLLAYALAVAGACDAWYRRGPERVPHRALSLLAILLGLLMAASIRLDLHNDATYTRLVHAFFLSLAVLAGLGAAAVAGLASRLVRSGRARAWAAAGAVVALTATATAVPLQAHLEEPYYRVYDAQAWDSVETFAHSGAGPTDRFLSHPWKAPVDNALTGAKPWAVLYPGTPAVHADDWDHYIATGGASAAWLAQRGIRYVIAPIPPNATATDLGNGVYRIG